MCMHFLFLLVVDFITIKRRRKSLWKRQFISASLSTSQLLHTLSYSLAQSFLVSLYILLVCNQNITFSLQLNELHHHRLEYYFLYQTKPERHRQRQLSEEGKKARRDFFLVRNLSFFLYLLYLWNTEKYMWLHLHGYFATFTSFCLWFYEKIVKTRQEEK